MALEDFCEDQHSIRKPSPEVDVLKESLTFKEEYQPFMDKLQSNHPVIYRVLTFVGIHYR